VSTSHAAVTIRPARVADAGAILKLVNELAIQQILLPRSPASVIENIRDFQIAEVDGRFAGCGALHVVWSDLAEVRSVAIDPKHQGLGIGRTLLQHLTAEAEEMGIPRLFAFTYVQAFFEKMGFEVVQHGDLPHKVFNDCLNCPKFTACDEIAMQRILRQPDPAATDPFGIPMTTIPLPRRSQ
jgi:amino-acid N-acetyltransferase